MVLLHSCFRVMNDGQRAQAQKVHLQKAKFFDLGHVELGHRQAVVGGQRQIVVRRLRGNDDTRRMGGSMAGHALHLQSRVDQLCDLRVGIVHPLKFRRYLQRTLQRHFQLHGHLLCHNIYLLIRNAHHAAHIADGVAGGHGAKGDDLSHMVGTIFPVDVIDHFLTALVAEVHIKIWHTDALRVQEALKDQVITDGVDIRDAHAVSRNAACAGATARAYRDTLTLGVVHVVPHDKIVVRVAHLFDHADLVFQTVFVGLRNIGAVAALQTFPAELFKKRLIIHTVRRFVIWNFSVSKIKIKVTLFGNFGGILAGFRHHGEQLVHFVCRFDIELVGLELHFIRILNGLAGLDAEQDALHFGIFLAQIVGVVGGCHGNSGLPCKLDELRQHSIILFQTMVLKLDIIVFLTEEVSIPQRCCFGALIIARQDGLWNFACQTGRQADQTFVIFFQQFLINAGLGIKALHKGGRHHFDQVFVAGLIFAQQDQVVVAVDLIYLVKAGAGGHIHLTADDGLDASLFCSLIKLHAAVHHAVVGAGNGGLSALFYAIHQLVNAAGTIQQAVLCVDVQMDKRPGIG